MRPLAAILIVVLALQSTQAESCYDFVSDSEGNPTLATVCFSSFPASHVELSRFSFSESGNELFKLGLSDEWRFTTSVGQFIESGNGLLGQHPEPLVVFASVSANVIVDQVSIPDLSLAGSLTLAAGVTDQIRFSYIDTNDQDREIRAEGTWQIVPEPNCAMLPVITALGAMIIRRRRKA